MRLVMKERAGTKPFKRGGGGGGGKGCNGADSAADGFGCVVCPVLHPKGRASRGAGDCA